MNNDAGIQLTQEGAKHWKERMLWSFEEAVLLLCCIDPTLHAAEKKKAASILHFAVKFNPNSKFDCNLYEMTQSLKSDLEDGGISFPASPESVIRWAAAKHPVPSVLLADAIH